MGWFNRGKSKWRGVDFMTLVPERALDHEAGSRAGQIVLLQPRYQGFPFGQLIQPRLKGAKRFIRIPLEDRGSLLWHHMDGQRTVGQLVLLVADHFEDDNDEVPQRVGAYLYYMFENGFIRFVNI
jgi:hypothetical protein